MTVEAADAYGFWIGLSDGTQARNYTSIALPATLPDEEAEKIVAVYQMDEGANHPGYRVFDTRAIDWSHYDFSIAVQVVFPEDLDWLQDLYDNETQVLISWKSGLRMLALFQKDGFRKKQYRHNVRYFGSATLKFHLLGPVSTNFTLAEES